MKILTGPSGSPHATRTKLGWVVWNVLRDSGSISVNRINIQDETGNSIEEMIKQSINMDFPERLIDDKREHSREDRDFLQQVGQSIHRDEGHYCVALPFREADIILPDNSAMAKKRLRGIQKRFEADLNYKEEYVAFMQTLIKKGYAEPAPDKSEMQNVWYIPHHGVFHKKKNKLRVVFDCSARYQGVALNDNLLHGPDMTNTLLGVLMRFREERVAVLGDIEAMFYQVKVPESERDYLRFYWWENGDTEKEPISFRMTVHLFGATSSPSVCNYALKRTVEDNREDFSQKVQDVIQKNMYVDDCLSSVVTDKEAIELVHGVTQICKSGGFRIAKWMSNSQIVIGSIPENDCAKEVKLWSLNNESPIERALGVYWFVENDSLGFQIQIKDKPATRRGILSVTSSVYDPLGIASPFVLKAKSVLQRLCKNGIGWDDVITGKELKDWTDWLRELPELEHVTIDRCYKGDTFGEVISCQLHGFADASDLGLGMVFYLRLVDDTGRIHCSFVLGKARVAPLKTVTIPRMELTAAAALVKLCKMVTEQLNYTIDRVFYWTDSTSVLKYIVNKNLRFHTFIANRIALIQEATNEDQWHYVNTKQNPADCASRGMNILKFAQNDIWFNGPDFLRKPESEWPIIEQHLEIVDNDPEIRATVNTVTELSEETKCDVIEKILNHYSDWFKLKRVIGWLLTAKDNLRKAVEKTRQITENVRSLETDPTVLDRKVKSAVSKERQDRLRRSNRSKIGNLSVKTLERAEAALISYEQHKYFVEESEILDKKDDSRSPRLKKSSKLYKLDPFLDDNMFRVGGRLERAELPYSAKHPLLLPKESVVSKLIMEDAHKCCGHLGKNTVLAFLRQKYWIIGARTYLKSLLSKCVTCRKYRAPCSKQKMANLPGERLTADEPPFSRIGMDFFGPFELKRGRSSVKRYGVVFTCLVSRAIHLEVAASLDTDSCINAIRRFIARRGKPVFIRSDNGTNLVGAQREMKEEIQKWNQDRINHNMLQNGIQWEFNPPAGSHFGGVWERLIRSVRQVLYSLMREQRIKLDDEGLQTLFCEVEVILNGRPLTEASDSVNDVAVLTPNHLLLLRPGEWFPPGTFVETDNYCRRRWRQIQYLADLFWKRWTKEYLPLLQTRQKWINKERNMKTGDLVMIADNSPRNSWTIGRIQDVVKDKHELVRFVKVKTPSNVLTRPVDKLVLILESDIDG